MPPLRTLILSVGALTTVSLGVFAYHEHQARISAENLARSLQTRLDRLAKSPTPSGQLVPALSPATSTTGMATPAGEFPESQFSTRPESQPRTMPTPGDFGGFLDSPEMQQLMNLRNRGALDNRYAALFKSLGLPREQLEKFQQLLIDKQSTMRDVVAAMRSQGLTPSRESADQMRLLVQNANAEIDAQIQATLGTAAYNQYQNYEQTQPQRNTVERIQQRLSYTSQPLSDQQAGQLVGLLTPTSPTVANGAESGGNLRRFSSGGSTATVPITDDSLQQASTILSSAQLTALQELQLEQQAQAQLSRRARENFNAARPGSPASN